MPDIPTSRANAMADAVNRRISKEEAGIRSDGEAVWYDALWAEAEAHNAKYGFWPVFEMGEIESDDPVLDIYGD